MYQQLLAPIKRLGDYNSGQMEILINAINAEKTGMSKTVILNCVYNKISAGENFESIIEWVQS